MIVKTSLNTITIPEENISFRTSTSLVTRVISRPMGFRSKNFVLEALQVLEHLHPQVEDRLLADPLGEIGVEVLQDAADNQDGQEIHAGDEQPAGIALRDVLVHGHLREIRTHRLHGGHEDAQENAERHVPPVGAEVRQQPPHEGTVVRFAEDFFFVHGPVRSAYRCSSSSSSCCFRKRSA